MQPKAAAITSTTVATTANRSAAIASPRTVGSPLQFQSLIAAIPAPASPASANTRWTVRELFGAKAS